MYTPTCVNNMEQDISFTHNQLGKSGDRFYKKNTLGSLQEVLNIVYKLVPNDNSWKNMTTIDLGFGSGLPSLILFLYIFEFGFNVGIELNEGLHNISNMNANTLQRSLPTISSKSTLRKMLLRGRGKESFIVRACQRKTKSLGPLGQSMVRFS